MSFRWLVCGFALGLGAVSALGMGAASAANKPSTRRQATPQQFSLKKRPVVALTFDDLPAAGGLLNDDSRTRILTTLADELKANHLKGTYGFVNAVDLQDDPDVREALRAWVNAGMNIGNHTWSHPSLSDDSVQEYEHDIAEDEPYLRAYAGGRDWHWFRYPYLEEGNTLEKRNDVLSWLEERGYRVAQVTLNFEDDDWSDPYLRCVAKHDDAEIAWLKQSYLENAAEFIRLGREEQQIAFGHEVPNVLLLHATDFTTLMLPSLIHLLRQDGFRFAPLPKIEQNPVYAEEPKVAVPEGGPLQDEFLKAQHIASPPFQPEPVEQLNNVCR